MIEHYAYSDGCNQCPVRNWVWKVVLSAEECLKLVSIEYPLKVEALGSVQCSLTWSSLVRSQGQSGWLGGLYGVAESRPLFHVASWQTTWRSQPELAFVKLYK
jgi:hypothetical protein